MVCRKVQSIQNFTLSIPHCISLLNSPSVKNFIVTLVSNRVSFLEAKKDKVAKKEGLYSIIYDLDSSRILVKSSLKQQRFIFGICKKSG